MRADLAFHSDTAETRRHLHAITTPLFTVIRSVSDGLQADDGVSVGTMREACDQFGKSLRYVAVLCEEELSDAEIREGTGPLPPTSRSDGAPLTEATRGDVFEFAWLIQQTLSICDGMYTMRVTKDTDGFRVLFDHSTTVVRFDTDVSFEVPGYAHDLALEDVGEQYIDRAIWSQSRAANKFDRLLTDLESEVPAANPEDEGACADTLAPLYQDGGFTFRVSRVGPAVSFAVDREGADVTPIRTLATPTPTA